MRARGSGEDEADPNEKDRASKQDDVRRQNTPRRPPKGADSGQLTGSLSLLLQTT
jgi:hypothetical protein